MSTEPDLSRRAILMIVEDRVGVLIQVAGILSARGYNIERLSVCPSAEKGLSEIRLVTTATSALLDQICKQLTKIVDVVRVDEVPVS